MLLQLLLTKAPRMADDLNLDLSFEVEDELDETENSSPILRSAQLNDNAVKS